MSKFLNFILYPKPFFRKLNDRKKFIIFGFLFIGIVDLLLYGIGRHLYVHLLERPVELAVRNLAVFAVSVIVFGCVDVLFVSYPLTDLFYRFAGEKMDRSRASARIVFMKIYIASHFIIAPASALVAVFYEQLVSPDARFFLLLYVFLELLVTVWATALLTRGIKILFGIPGKYTIPVFVTLILWRTILVGRVLFFMIDFTLNRFLI